MSAQESKAEMWLGFSVCACKTVGTTFLKRPPKRPLSPWFTPTAYQKGLNRGHGVS